MPENLARHIRGRTRQRGTVTIEFMIVAPILLMLLLAISEFGHALYQYNTLTKSVRDGARYLSKEAYKGSQGFAVLETIDVTETKNLVVYGTTTVGVTPKVPGLTTSHITVLCVGCGTAIEHVEVTAQWPYQSIMGTVLPLPGFGNLSLGFNLNTSATMRVL